MRAAVDVEDALAYVSAPTSASGVIRLGAGMEAADAKTTPQPEMSASSCGHAERRFGRAVTAIDRRSGTWAPASLGLACASPQGPWPEDAALHGLARCLLMKASISL